MLSHRARSGHGTAGAVLAAGRSSSGPQGRRAHYLAAADTNCACVNWASAPCTHINLVERGDPAEEPEGEAPCQVPVVFAVLLSEPEVEKAGEGNKREQRLH